RSLEQLADVSHDVRRVQFEFRADGLFASIILPDVVVRLVEQILVGKLWRAMAGRRSRHQVSSRGSNANSSGLLMETFLKSGCAGLSRKLASLGMIALGNARIAERASRT